MSEKPELTQSHIIPSKAATELKKFFKLTTLEERFPKLWAALIEECGVVPDETGKITITSAGVELEVFTSVSKKESRKERPNFALMDPKEFPDFLWDEIQKVKESNGTPSD